MPVLLVKSFESSTRALAGSHAAQHNVNCLAWADAWPPRHEATTTAVAPNARIVRIITTSLLSQAIACLTCQSHFALPRGRTRRLKSRDHCARGLCLVLLLSRRFSLNIFRVNRRRQ